MNTMNSYVSYPEYYPAQYNTVSDDILFIIALFFIVCCCGCGCFFF